MNTFSFGDRVNAMISCAIIGFFIGYGFEHPLPIGHYWWLAIGLALTFAFRVIMSLTGKMSNGHLDTQFGKMEKIVFTVGLFIIAWTIVQSYLK